jgi:type IV pilus assembly protein PilO
MKKSTVSFKFLDPFFEKISKLTKVQRILICVGAVLLIVGPVVYFSFMPKHKEITRLTEEFEKLTAELEDAKRRASQLGKYKAEMKEVEAKFEIARQALPESEEIPTLLTSISHAGQDSGLEFILFRPERENTMGFYAEIPVSIQVVGEYHDTALFFQRVSHLDRIVNIKDVRMSDVKRRGRKATGEDKNELNISCTAVTYKFLEQTPETTSKKK